MTNMPTPISQTASSRRLVAPCPKANIPAESVHKICREATPGVRRNRESSTTDRPPKNLNRHPQKTSTITLKPPLKIIPFLLLFLAIPAVSIAEEPSGTQEEEPSEAQEKDVRFQTSIQAADDRPSLDLRVYRPTDERRAIWHVTVHSETAPDDFICLTTLPLEAGDDFYEYEVHHADLEDGGVQGALLDITPSGDGAPLDPPAYQLAFALTPDAGAPGWRCSLVARGEYTELDGGPRLTIDDAPALLRSDVADRLEFCGTRPGESDEFERFDPQQGRFVRASPLDIADGDAEKLRAEIPEEPIEPPLTTGFYSWLVASSDVRGAPAGAAPPRPRRLGELDVSTAWIEGADGLGVGEFVTAGVDNTASIHAVRIFPGHGGSPEAFQAYARPTRLLLGLADGRRYVVEFPDYDFETLHASSGFYIELPEPSTSNCLSVMILAAEAGTPPDETNADHRRYAEAIAISEITPFSEFDAHTEGETAHRLVDAIAAESDRERRDRIAEFGTLIPSAMVEATEELLREGDEQTRSRVVPLLGYVDPDRALPVLRAHFLRAETHEEDYRRTRRAIAAHGPQGAPILIDVLNELDMEEKKYVDAVRLIGRIGTDVHRRRLIAELGQGDDFLRRERIRAVANGGIGVVPALISHADAHVDTEAGLDALTCLVFIGQRRFSTEQARIDAPDELRDVYLNSSVRAQRIRAIEALGYFAHPEGSALLGGEVLADDPDPVVRAFAAGALQLYDDDDARTALEAALDDESPDVRIAAARSLNRREDAADATDAVIAYVHHETWPAGLNQGLMLLAHSPHAEAKEAIADIVAEDITSAKASNAMRAMRRAERALPASHIKAHLADDATPPSILAQLVQMLGVTDYDGAVDILIDIADRSYPPLDDRPPDELDSLAHRAFLSLGTTRREEAQQFLFRAAFDIDRHESDRYHALHGLGFFPDAELAIALHQRADELSPRLQRRLHQSISMIENRLAIEDAEEELQHLIDSLEDDTDRHPDEEFIDELPAPQ